LTRLAGAAIVLGDRILSPGTLVLDGDRIADVRLGAQSAGTAGRLHGCYVVPGFVDAHVHGIDGHDTLDDGQPVAAMARRLPRVGVTAFSPTTVACGPRELARVLEQVRHARETPEPGAARVLPAHLESNFVNPDWCGAQPRACLRMPRPALHAGCAGELHGPHAPGHGALFGGGAAAGEFDGAAILQEIAKAGAQVGTVTLAPELDGGLELVEWLTARGHTVSLGHSGASYEQALDAIAAGARRGTHLFNRMAPLHQRAPGLAGAILQAEEVAAEIICDGHHVHPGLVRMAVAAKGVGRVLAITDGTALSGCPVGSRAHLGGVSIAARADGAFLADGTRAGSTITMDGAFRVLIDRMGLSLVDAAAMCATTPARELGLREHGVIAPGAVADLVVLDAEFRVLQTYVGGQLAYERMPEDRPADTNRASA
jgi:N-acetylglucosamine-6-phosphate deacetylase